MDRRPPRSLRTPKPLGTTIFPDSEKVTLSPDNKVIQGMWVGSRLSAMESLSIRSFLANGHEFHLYVHGPCEGIPKGTVVKDANSIIDKSEIAGYMNLAVFSDVFRYTLLQRESPRWWVDLDTIALRPFEFKEEYVFASEYLQTGQRLIDNGILKVPKESHLIKMALESCNRQDKAHPTGTLSHGALAMGPELMTSLTSGLELLHYVKPPSVFTGIAPWDIPNAFIDPYMNLDLSKAHAAHMWQSRWTTTGQDKDDKYHPNSLYERLKQKYPE
jgi:hypothetical protein